MASTLSCPSVSALAESFNDMMTDAWDESPVVGLILEDGPPDAVALCDIPEPATESLQAMPPVRAVCAVVSTLCHVTDESGRRRRARVTVAVDKSQTISLIVYRDDGGVTRSTEGRGALGDALRMAASLT